jgi:ABC-type dipeptide/oligopeptide/nickel transport system ATPase subunit
MLRPRLLVADEPVSMVGASLRASILDLLVQLRDARHQHLYITHDLATAYRVQTRFSSCTRAASWRPARLASALQHLARSRPPLGSHNR